MSMRFQSDNQEEENPQYDAYTALEERKTGSKAVYFYVAAGLGLLILALAYVMLVNGSGRQETADRLNLIDKRLEDMEFRLGNLVQSTADLDGTSMKKVNADLGRRLDTLEKKLEGRLNQINARLAKLEKQQSAVPPKPPAKAAKPPCCAENPASYREKR